MSALFKRFPPSVAAAGRRKGEANVVRNVDLLMRKAVTSWTVDLTALRGRAHLLFRRTTAPGVRD
jgi:hypothetical protein